MLLKNNRFHILLTCLVLIIGFSSLPVFATEMDVDIGNETVVENTEVIEENVNTEVDLPETETEVTETEIETDTETVTGEEETVIEENETTTEEDITNTETTTVIELQDYSEQLQEISLKLDLQNELLTYLSGFVLFFVICLIFYGGYLFFNMFF